MFQDQYDIVTATNIKDLVYQVNIMLTQGWVAHGSLVVVFNPENGKTTHHQPIILRDGAAQ